MKNNKYFQEETEKSGFTIAPQSFTAVVDPLLSGAEYWSLQVGGLGSANFEAAWAYATGSRVTVGIVDEGVNHTHLDLTDNYATALDFDPRDSGTDQDARPDDATQLHGTEVAGVIAGSILNTIGSIGAAPEATITASYLRYGDNVDLGELAQVLARQAGYDVANNSWGFTTAFADNFSLEAFAAMAAQIEKAATLGRGGLGTALVVAGGNGKLVMDGQNIGDDSNFHNLSNSRYAIAVGAHDAAGKAAFFSSPGTNLLISAPGVGLVTTTGAETGTDASTYVSGTSFAAPLVSSAIALMLEVNPRLGYRDIQEILAITATPSTAASATANGAVNVNGGGMIFDREMGFGALNAEAAVKLARHWDKTSTAANERHIEASFDLPAASDGLVQSLSLNIAKPESGDFSVDFVELSLEISDPALKDLSIELVSPDGTVALIAPNLRAIGGGTRLEFTFSSVATWGESPYGTWTLNLRHPTETAGFEVLKAELDIYGDEAGADNTFYFTPAFARLAAQDPDRAVIDNSDGGSDTLNFAAADSALVIDLSGATASALGDQQLKLKGDFARVVGTTFDDVIIGSATANSLIGDLGDDVLKGGGGGDLIDGGDGFDTADFSGGAAVTIDMTNGIHGGAAAGSTLVSIERFVLSRGSDIFRGSGADEHIEGGAGDDNLSGGDGNDRLDGGAGSDLMRGGNGNDIYVVDRRGDLVDERGTTGLDTVETTVDFDLSDRSMAIGEVENLVLLGSARKGTGNRLANEITGNERANTLKGMGGDDILDGGDGDDVLIGGQGADVMRGGKGFDTASYADAGAGVTASLANPKHNTGIAKGDRYHSIEKLAGSSHADTLIGDSGRNHLDGGDGDDTLVGRGGADVLYGGDGKDVLIGGSGGDVLRGGKGRDTASYEDASGGVVANLANSHHNKGDARGDRYASIENLLGSSKGDKLTGDRGANLLDGAGGHDVLYGRGGNDTLVGGKGADILTGGGGSDTFLFRATNESTVAARGRDTILDFSRKQGDKIDLRPIDAITSTSKNDAFSFIGQKAFSAKAGELRFEQAKHATFVYADVNGDGKADFAIRIEGIIDLTKGDFHL